MVHWLPVGCPQVVYSRTGSLWGALSWCTRALRCAQLVYWCTGVRSGGVLAPHARLHPGPTGPEYTSSEYATLVNAVCTMYRVAGACPTNWCTRSSRLPSQARVNQFRVHHLSQTGFAQCIALPARAPRTGVFVPRPRVRRPLPGASTPSLGASTPLEAASRPLEAWQASGCEYAT